MSKGATGDLHTEVWERHWMSFDPNVAQNTRVGVAHQLRYINNSLLWIVGLGVPAF